MHISTILLLSILFYLLVILTPIIYFYFFFFFNDTATTEIYTLSLHDALPISTIASNRRGRKKEMRGRGCPSMKGSICATRSEEHTSELQSPCNLVCRLLLEKKKLKNKKCDFTYENKLDKRQRRFQYWLHRQNT